MPKRDFDKTLIYRTVGTLLCAPGRARVYRVGLEAFSPVQSSSVLFDTYYRNQPAPMRLGRWPGLTPDGGPEPER